MCSKYTEKHRSSQHTHTHISDIISNDLNDVYIYTNPLNKKTTLTTSLAMRAHENKDMVASTHAFPVGFG